MDHAIDTQILARQEQAAKAAGRPLKDMPCMDVTIQNVNEGLVITATPQESAK